MQQNKTALTDTELQAFSREMVRIIDEMTVAESRKERQLHALALWAALECAGFLMPDVRGTSLEASHV